MATPSRGAKTPRETVRHEPSPRRSVWRARQFLGRLAVEQIGGLGSLYHSYLYTSPFLKNTQFNYDQQIKIDNYAFTLNSYSVESLVIYLSGLFLHSKEVVFGQRLKYKWLFYKKLILSIFTPYLSVHLQTERQLSPGHEAQFSCSIRRHKERLLIWSYIHWWMNDHVWSWSKVYWENIKGSPQMYLWFKSFPAL